MKMTQEGRQGDDIRLQKNYRKKGGTIYAITLVLVMTIGFMTGCGNEDDMPMMSEEETSGRLYKYEQDTDTLIVTEGYEKNPHDIVLTDEQKTLLQTMCNYLPDFSEATLMEDERFWSNFIYSSFTSVPMEYGKYKPIYGEGEQVMVYREDWGYEEPAFKISERYVREYVRLILGVEMPEFKPAFEDIKENQSVYYYRDGYYYIGGSDFGEAEYRFRDLEVSRGQYDTSALVRYDILLHNADTGEQEVEGTVQFHLNYADNANGFVIVGKEVEWD